LLGRVLGILEKQMIGFEMLLQGDFAAETDRVGMRVQDSLKFPQRYQFIVFVVFGHQELTSPRGHDDDQSQNGSLRATRFRYCLRLNGLVLHNPISLQAKCLQYFAPQAHGQ
jgi:hypothetical protein